MAGNPELPTDASRRFARARPSVDGDPTTLIKDCEPIERNLRALRKAWSEIAGQALPRKIDSPSEMQCRAILETNGAFSFIAKTA